MPHLFAATGAPAMFVYVRHQNYTRSFAYPVLAWDDNGAPWIALDEARCLTRATDVKGYEGMGTIAKFDGYMSAAQIIPAHPGWTVKEQIGSEDEYVEPVVAWALDHQGVGRPMIDDGGYLIVRHELDNRGPYELIGPHTDIEENDHLKEPS